MEQENMVQNATETEEVIASNQKWFDFYVKLPKIVTIVLGVLFFIMGAAIEEGELMFAFLFGGAIMCAITYALLKLSLCYQILHIYYLKKLVSQKENENK